MTTRLGLGGFSRSPYGSFAGKSIVTITGTIAVTLAPTSFVGAGHVAGSVTGAIAVTLKPTSFIGLGEISEGDIVATSTRIDSILTRTRDTLADPAKDRWSDERLLRLLDEAQKDIAKQAKILKGTYDVPLSIGIANYTLPDNVWLITRATFDSTEIPLVSYDQQDEQARKMVVSERYSREDGRRGYGSNIGDSYGRINWELAEGSRVESLIFDNRNINDIRVYPIPNTAIADSVYSFYNEGEVIYVGDELMGVVTSIDDYTIDTVYGITTALYDPDISSELFDSPYGVVTGASESVALVKIWYIRIPDQLTSLADTLELPPMFDVALKHYVIGHALRDDIDVQYRQMGAESLELYARELRIADETNSSDGTRSATNFNTSYRGGFE